MHDTLGGLLAEGRALSPALKCCPSTFCPKKNLDPTITSIFNSQPKSAKMVMDYDSDSTEGDYTETNVLLGYASKDADEDTISKLGGLPVRTNPSPRPCAHLVPPV